MRQTRFDASEKQTIQKLTETFGKDFWAKVLFVLTFANEVEALTSSMGSDVERLFTDKMKAWHAKLVHRLKECGVKKEVADNIKVIPAGYSKPLNGSSNPWKLPGIPNWFHNFWYKCAETMDEKGMPALVTTNIRRLKSPEEISKLDLSKCPIEEQPIPIRIRQIGAGDMLTASLVGSTAAIGGAVGSLVGLIVAGPVGAEVGDLVGCTVGAAAACSCHLLIQAQKKRKKNEK